jgi:DNA-binding transcriptional regulator YdaS (Cro superfamily)
MRRMDLADYLAQERGSQSRLASALGIPAPLLSQWATKARQVPAERCPVIERATSGAVRCEDLRPDVAWDVLRMQAGTACPDTGKRRRATDHAKAA